MPALSFRFRLILAMSLIVIGVTGATLYVTQKRVQATYHHLFEEQFQTQIRFFSDSRLRQLDAVAKKCESIATSPRLVSALEKGDSDLIYENVLSELREYYASSDLSGSLLKPPAAMEGRKADKPLDILRKGRANSSTRLQGQPFVRVIDARGVVIEPKDSRATLLNKVSGNSKRTEQMRMFANQTPAEAFKQQEIGYLALQTADAAAQLREFIITPIVHHNSKETLGALVLGFPVRDFGEKAMYDFSEKTLLSGVWIDEKIYTQTIPESVLDEVAKNVADKIKRRLPFTEEKPVIVDGVPHRLIFKVLNPDSPFPPAAQVCLYSLAEVFTVVQDLRSKILSFGGAALIAGIGLILFISHGFSTPIEQLVKGTRRIREGDFTVKVPVKSRDEIGTLASSFNDMADELALKERYKSVLAQVTDKQVAEELISGRMTLGGEVRQVSMLFCDIRGFTALTEDMPPTEVIAMLNEHMTAMNRIVHEHYGVVDKFVGDLIMAVFGAPKSYGNDALHAVKCALEMMTERRRLNATTRHAFEIGIGIATGEVVAGCMGSQDRLNYTVLGERVNLASRLCSKAGSTELLIDETTYAQLPPGFLAEPTEPMPLKGFSAPVPAYRLTEARE